jgi:signal transduction histidine kinase/methanogenic corrinoid protein MtbC1
LLARTDGSRRSNQSDTLKNRMEAADLLRELAEAAPLGVLVIASGDEGLQVEMASRLVEELSGLDPVRSPVDTLFPGIHLQNWQEELCALAIGERSVRSLLVDDLPYGQKWELDHSRTMWQITSYRLSEDRWLAFTLDLTGQYRYESMLEDALAGKTRVFETMGEVVHELRQPVTSVAGFAALILAESPTETIEQYASVISEQASTLNQLIDDLLTAGLQAAGRLRVEAEQVPGEELAASLESVARSFGDVDVTVEGRLPSTTVMVDTRRAAQVVRGLIQNATKYGGPKVGVKLASQRDTITVEVHDDGPGLTMEEATSIFDPFTTGAAGSSVSSTGIGLAIARSLVADMGGLLDYVREDEETVFRLTLPRSGGLTVVQSANLEPERHRLITELTAFDSDAARHRLNRLALLQQPGRIIAEVVRPAMYEVGERWMRGEISVAQEHHATSIVQSWLMGVLAKFQPYRREVVVCASAPGNQHEIGLISVAVTFAEAGYRVVYIGRSAPAESLISTVHETKARALLLSLNTVGDIDGLRQVVDGLEDLIAEGLVVGYGGRLFAEGHPHAGLPGVYLGWDAPEAVAVLERLDETA